MRVYPTPEEVKRYVNWAVNKYLEFISSTGKTMSVGYVKFKYNEAKNKLLKSSLKMAKIYGQSKIVSFLKALPNLHAYIKNEKILEEYQLFEGLNLICTSKNFSVNKLLNGEDFKEIDYKKVYKLLSPQGYESHYFGAEICNEKNKI